MTFQQFFDHKGEHQCQGSQSCIYCMAGIVFDVTTTNKTTILILLAITRWRRKNIDHCYLLLVIFHVLDGRSLLETQAVKHKYFGFECGITCIMSSSSLSCAMVTTCTTHQKKQATQHHWTAQLQKMWWWQWQQQCKCKVFCNVVHMHVPPIKFSFGIHNWWGKGCTWLAVPKAAAASRGSSSKKWQKSISKLVAKSHWQQQSQAAINWGWHKTRQFLQQKPAVPKVVLVLSHFYQRGDVTVC